jgi:hypothetical protein
MTQNHLASLSVEELQGYYSDFHKDFYGFRPRGFGTPEDWRNRTWLEENINAIHDAMDSMKTTFAGREELRERGWVVEETDPEEARMAQFLEQQRTREMAEQIADLDAKFFGEMV